ncbi:MAG: GTP-binding protein [Acidobacteria bacterium]|nr:GTP-binding protein [Acidobacteriota bacterium]
MLPGVLPDGRLPLFLLTGFLGSGKTTLLNGLLRSPDLAHTAVLMNEFGEIGIDNLLVSEIRDELVLLESGCVCCEYLGDLSGAIQNLFAKREAGEIPQFTRLVLETTGLADPAPILDTLLNDLGIVLLLYLDTVIVTVDAVFGLDQLVEHPEAVKQAALADRIVLTKTDLAPPETRDALVGALRRLNPTVPIVPVVLGEVSPEALLGASLMDAEARKERLGQWVAGLDLPKEPEAAHPHGPHDAAVRSFSVRFDEAVDFSLFARFFSHLTHEESPRLLRVKGLLRIAGDEERPLVVQAVQRVLYPTQRLPLWPTPDRTSRLVFIAKNLSSEREHEIRTELATIVSETKAKALAPPPPQKPVPEPPEPAPSLFERLRRHFSRQPR